jgi:S-DNA-T family DNA segregation ATPase FtsK/SpoIIIE
MPETSPVPSRSQNSGPKHSRLLDSRRLSELWGFLLLVVGLLILLSLVSHSPLDRSLDSTGGFGTVRNWIGPVGAYLSDAFEQLFGWVAFALPLALLYVGVRLVLVRPPEAPWTKAAGFLLFAFSLMALLDLFPLTPPIGGLIRGSGLGGYLLAMGLVHIFNRLGGAIVAAATFLSSLFLISSFSFGKVFDAAKAHFAFARRLGAKWQAWREARRRERMRRQVEKSRQAGKEPVVVQSARELSPRSEPRTVPVVGPAPAPAFAAATPAPSAEPFVQPGSVMDILRPRRADAPLQPAANAGPRGRPSQEEWPSKPPRIVGRGPHAYKLPSSTLLRPPDSEEAIDEAELKGRAVRLREKLAEFGVLGEVTQIHPGPVVTTYEFKPEAGIKYSRIVNLADDLCLAMRAESILIDRIPGKSTVGIEVPNLHRETIHLRGLIESHEFIGAPSKLSLCLGKDITGKMKVSDLSQMPHLLLAGSTGSGKSVSINSFVVSMLYKATPDQVKLIMIDPKRLELSLYEGIPHLFTPIVTEPKVAANVLRRATMEMEGRLKKLAEQGVRNIEQYNRIFEDEPTPNLFESKTDRPGPLPYLVIIIDELADLMMVEPQGVEEAITRLAQMARAVGIHLILSTQRPSVDVITGLIKANLPSRIAFRVASKVDSRTILDSNGAEALLGRGDMLFLPPGSSRLQRLHSCLVTEGEIEKVVDWWKSQSKPQYNEEFLQPVKDQEAPGEPTADEAEDAELDEVYEEAVRLVVESGKASTSLLQRRLRLGYGRAARLIDMMEKDGIVTAPDGPKPREVLKRPDWLQEIDKTLR